MFEEKSSDFKTLVLLRVIKKLIENTESYGIYKLEKILSGSSDDTVSKINSKKDYEHALIIKKNQIKEEVKNKFKMNPSPILGKSNVIPSTVLEKSNAIASPDQEFSKSIFAPKKVQNFSPNKNVRVPQRKRMDEANLLPAHLRYLAPTATSKKEQMDLGELNPYVVDPNIDSIEVEGENEKIYVIGKMGKRPISLVLDREGIEAVIDKFSLESKIPKVDGLFKVSINNLILTAMVSNVISSRFIIKKIKF